MELDIGKVLVAEEKKGRDEIAIVDKINWIESLKFLRENFGTDSCYTATLHTYVCYSAAKSTTTTTFQPI